MKGRNYFWADYNLESQSAGRNINCDVRNLNQHGVHAKKPAAFLSGEFLNEKTAIWYIKKRVGIIKKQKYKAAIKFQMMPEFPFVLAEPD
jgi:hypothetical protein